MDNNTHRYTIHPSRAVDEDSPVQISYRHLNWDRLSELEKKYDFTSKAEAVRYFTNLGMSSFVDNNPTDNSESVSKPSGADVPRLRDYIPEDEEDGIDLLGELPDEMKNAVMDIINADPEIERDGVSVYRK